MYNSIAYGCYYKKHKKLIYDSIKLQAVSLLIVAVLARIFSDSVLVVSVTIGALCAIVPNLCFAYFSFRHISTNKKAHKALNGVYLGEALKFILVICLLVITNRAAQSIEYIDSRGILIGFIFIFFSMIFLPLVAKNKKIISSQ